jgi:hypothetical protein
VLATLLQAACCAAVEHQLWQAAQQAKQKQARQQHWYVLQLQLLTHLQPAEQPCQQLQLCLMLLGTLPSAPLLLLGLLHCQVQPLAAGCLSALRLCWQVVA